MHPHLVFDVRRAPAEPLPSELKGALKLPGAAVAWALLAADLQLRVACHPAASHPHILSHFLQSTAW